MGSPLIPKTGRAWGPEAFSERGYPHPQRPRSHRKRRNILWPARLSGPAADGGARDPVQGQHEAGPIQTQNIER